MTNWSSILHILLLFSSTSESYKCSVIQLRRQIQTSTQSHDRQNFTSVLHLSSLHLSIAACLETLPLSSLSLTTKHLQQSLTMSKYVMHACSTTNSNEKVTSVTGYLLRSATILYANALSANEQSLQARQYFRLLLRLWSNHLVIDNTPLHLGLANVELHICTAASYPISLCNISAISYHSRQSMLSFHPTSYDAKKNELDATVDKDVDLDGKMQWDQIFTRTSVGNRIRTHIEQVQQKIYHDIQQIQYLLRFRSSIQLSTPSRSNLYKVLQCYKRFNTILQSIIDDNKTNRNANQVVTNPSNNLAWETVDRILNKKCSSEDQQTIQKSYAKVLHIPNLKTSASVLKSSVYVLNTRHTWMNSVLNSNLNIQHIEQNYMKNGVAIIDNILNPEILESLQSFANEAMIFQDSRNGYIGAYAKNGLLFPTTTMLATVIGRTFPNIISRGDGSGGGLPLVQMWMYKYSTKDNWKQKVKNSGIALHADDAVINVNIWITKTEHDVEQSGGLLLYPNLHAEKKDSFEDFNTQSAFRLNVENEEVIQVYHKPNRCVIFDSKMYHQSDSDMMFGKKYENSRINLTLLFGRRKSS